MSSKSKSLRAFASSCETKMEEAKPALVPKLRFPEFRGAEGWNSTRLGDLCEVITKGSTPTSYGFNYVDSGIRFVKIESLSGGSVDCSKTAYITEKCNASFFRSQLKENDILFSIAGALGVIALVDRKILPANVNQAIGIVRLKHGYSHQFLLHQLQGELIQAEIQRIRAGAAQPNISLSQLGDFAALLPTPAEQQKIAECLSSVDELIAAQARKVEALKTHKKGLMQQLFPREGETQPRLRFPEFQNAGEWETKGGGDLFTNRKEKGEAGLPIYSVTINDGMVPRASFDRNFYDIEDPAGNRKVHKGDIAYNMMRMWQGAQGVALEDCMVSPAYVVLKPSSGVSSDFFAYFFKLPQSLRLLTITSRGLTKDRLRLYFDDFAKMRLCVPDKDEQHRIASCLSSLDALIAAETQKLEALKTYKKGLMQQLFPSPKGEKA